MKASPLARRIAAEKGIDLTQVAGTGPEGRIVKRDIEGYVPSAAPAAAAPQAAGIPAADFGEPPTGDDVEIIEASKLRSRIASRMVEAKQITVEEAEKLLAALEGGD